MRIKLSLNGEERSVEVEDNLLLIDLLREGFGLTGTKLSCDLQVCGACTVLVDGRAVSSCTTLAAEADGRSVTTIEGLGRPGALHPVQEAFLAHGALQCGFCTPGMVMATVALCQECPDAGSDTVAEYLKGNICRCTGYVSILAAAQGALARSRGA